MSDLLDSNTLFEIAGDDVESFLLIIDDFQENGTQLVNQMSDAIGNSDLAAIRAAAHQFKGSSGMLGMNKLYEMCKAVEGMEVNQIDNHYISRMSEVFESSIQLARETLEQI